MLEGTYALFEVGLAILRMHQDELLRFEFVQFLEFFSESICRRTEPKNTLLIFLFLQVWDNIMLEGTHALFEVGLAILRMHHDELLRFEIVQFLDFFLDSRNATNFFRNRFAAKRNQGILYLYFYFYRCGTI